MEKATARKGADQRDVLEKAAEMVKKGRGINLQNLTNAEKADVIGALNGEYRLFELLNSVKMAKSSYFYQRSAALRLDKYEELRSDVSAVFYENTQCYGYRRVHAVLRKNGRTVSKKVIRRITREEQLMEVATTAWPDWVREAERAGLIRSISKKGLFTRQRSL